MKQVNKIPSRQELNVFRLLRIARNRSVEDVADALSITRSYVNAIENGTRFPSDRLLRDYAIVLGVSEDTLRFFKPKDGTSTKFETALLQILELIVPEREEEYRLDICLGGTNDVLISKMIPPGSASTYVELTGRGLVAYDLYVNGEYLETKSIEFTEVE